MGRIISTTNTYQILEGQPLDTRYRFNTNLERDALSISYRYEGLITYVKDPDGAGGGEGTVYMLRGGIDDADWIELATGSAVGDTIYPYTDEVTNPIGDLILGSTHDGRNLNDMVKDMISPYVQPIVSDPTNDGNGTSFIRYVVREIGSGILAGSTVSVAVSISYSENLRALDPVIISNADGVFDILPEYPYPAPSPPDAYELLVLADLNPVTTQTYVIAIYAYDINEDITNTTSTTITFNPRLFWGSTLDGDLVGNHPGAATPIANLALSGGSNSLGSSYKRDYALSTGTYGYVLIPAMMHPVDPATVKWTDVSDPSAPASIGMIYQGTININNNIGIYDYEVWRTPYSNNAGLTLRAN